MHLLVLKLLCEAKIRAYIYNLIIVKRKRARFFGSLLNSGSDICTDKQAAVSLAVDSEISAFGHADFIHIKCMCCFANGNSTLAWRL